MKKYLLAITLVLPLFLSSCWFKVTETRGKVDTKNLVTFEEIRDNPEKYFAKEISFEFKVMRKAGASYGMDTNCCSLDLLPINYLGTIQSMPKDYLNDLQRIMKQDFKNNRRKTDKSGYKYLQNHLNDLKSTNIKNALDDFGTITAYVNCPLPAELYNRGLDSIANKRFATKDEIWGEGYYPKLSNCETGGIATGILFNVETKIYSDSIVSPKIEEIIGKKLHTSFLEIYLTGIQFKKNLF